MSNNAEDIIGKVFGKLTVISEPQPVKDNSGSLRRQVEVLCSCGNVGIKKLKYLKSGETKSCGKCTLPFAFKSPTNQDVLKIDPLDNEISLVGKKFGRLEVLSVGFVLNKRRMIQTLCACGNTSIVSKKAVVSGHTKSCGCYKEDTLGQASKTHGKSQEYIYSVWNNMKQRCNNPNNTSYDNYGGRGIRICDEWSKFENFLQDMGEPLAGLTLERIDVNGNYCKDNCKWANYYDQAYNTRQYANNTSGKTGVVLNNRTGNWVASISKDGVVIYLGTYPEKEDAIFARKQAELNYHGFNKE